MSKPRPPALFVSSKARRRGAAFGRGFPSGGPFVAAVTGATV